MLIELPKLETIVKANRSRFFFLTEACGPGALEVVKFEGQERLSGPYDFTVELQSADPDLDLGAMVGEPASLVMMREMGNPRPFHGVVLKAEQTGRTRDRYGYRVMLAPRMRLLDHSVRSRVFQERTVEEIVAEVLEGAGIGPEDQDWKLEDALPKREYCVQYRESDLAFVRRLLEHEGIYFFFRQEAQREVIVFGDRPSAHPATREEAIELRPRDGFTAAEETVHDCMVRDQVVTGQVLLNEYNYRDAGASLRSEAEVAGGHTGVMHEYGAHYKTDAEGARLARVRSEEIARERRVLEGESDAYGFRSGHLFTLESHFRSDLNREYLLIDVRHAGSQRGGGGLSGMVMDTTYTNRFRAIPSNVPFRPRRETDIPRMHGIMTASIEAVHGSQYAQLDKEGHYRVKMPFDLEEREKTYSSREVRLAQPYTGTGYGIHFPTHAGAEMVFACVDGDIDRPIGLGTVPHSHRSSPVTSENKYENVIRTVAHHELIFDDCLKDEKIRLASMGNTEFFTKRNKEQEIQENETHSVGGDRSTEVKGSHRETVGGSQTVNVAGGQTETVGRAKAETIALAKALSIGAGYQVSVAGAMNETVGGAKAEEVGGAKVSIVGAHAEERVSGTHAHTVGGDQTIEVGGNREESIVGAEARTIGEGMTVRAGAEVEVESAADMILKSGAHTVLDASDGITIRCGDSSITISPEGIKVNGKDIVTEASGKVVSKGKKVQLNP